MTDLTAADIAGQHAEEHQYAVIAGRASAPEPFSIRPRLWPAALEVDHSLPSCLPTDWQTILPAGADALDRLILRLVYGAIELMPVAAQLAVLPDEEWHLLLMRWNAIRACQRAYIVEHPACIPDRLERQTWLSRLWIATPRVLAAAVYQRQRWQIDPTEPQHAVLPRKQANRGYRDPSAPAAPAIIPGAAAPASTAGITAAGPTLADAMARRAQRAPAEERSVGKEYGA